MNKKIIFTLTLIACLQLCGCGSEKSTDIVGEASDANCSANQTGELLYTNAGNAVMFVVIDGFDYGGISAGQTLRANLDAGFQVSARSFFQDGSTACSAATVPIVACRSQEIVCDTPH